MTLAIFPLSDYCSNQIICHQIRTAIWLWEMRLTHRDFSPILWHLCEYITLMGRSLRYNSSNVSPIFAEQVMLTPYASPFLTRQDWTFSEYQELMSIIKQNSMATKVFQLSNFWTVCAVIAPVRINIIIKLLPIYNRFIIMYYTSFPHHRYGKRPVIGP